MFDKSIEDLNKEIKATLIDITSIEKDAKIDNELDLSRMEKLFNDYTYGITYTHIKKLEDILDNASDVYVTVYVVILVENIKKLAIKDCKKSEYLSEISKIVYENIKVVISPALAKDIL